MIASLCILILACIYIYFFPFIPKRKKHYTYALLLGCPAHDDGTMSSSQIKRCDLAIKAYQQNLYDTLIISGSNVKMNLSKPRLCMLIFKMKWISQPF